MNEIVMPKLSDTMTEGRLVSWKKQVGEEVRRGDVLAEVETDKANMELEAFTSGVLLEIRVQAGEQAEVGTVIAVIGSADEKAAAAPTPASVPQEGAPAGSAAKGAAADAGTAEGRGAVEVQPAAETQAPSEAVAPIKVQVAEGVASQGQEPANQTADKAQAAEEGAAAARPPEASAPEARPPEASAPEARPPEARAPEARASEAIAPEAGAPEAGAPEAGAPEAGATEGQSGAAAAAAHGERAAPVVRRRARELGIDLAQLKGSGPDGRILLQDLEGRQAAPQAPAAPRAEAQAGDEIQPMSKLRGAVARAVAESWRSIPHFSVTTDVRMGEAEAMRRQLKESGVAVTLNDLIVKGVSLALRKFPRLNASFAAEAVTVHSRISIGIAVGMPDGVLIPVIPDCQQLSLQEIACASRRLIGLARGAGLSEQQMSGGTFSVSNLGMYGVSQFSAIIYPSQAAVLAVGAVSDAVVVHAGAPACARVMKLTLSADHRVVDGAYAAEFLAELKHTLENPVGLLI
jgi:pyruvate dehydrogenase E2 component (dihydrolipoamide acetyltransferase)